ncbi:MAG: aspartate/glutamate racemase family protein, partial [Candidatus Eisenbacteria bacterium]|nr:aspartate/glutamate racemase family protein [Candidatus Eisenbacteria bacterium]
IGVIGTTGTVGSRAHEKAIAEIDASCAVEAAACPLFVPLAEEGWVDGEIPLGIARSYLEPIRRSGVDTVVLGCTHYPLLREVIGEALGPQIDLVDTAEATVHDVREKLESLGLARQAKGAGERTFYLSDVPLRFQQIGERFLGEPIENLHWIEQSDIPWYER